MTHMIRPTFLTLTAVAISLNAHALDIQDGKKPIPTQADIHTQEPATPDQTAQSKSNDESDVILPVSNSDTAPDKTQPDDLVKDNTEQDEPPKTEEKPICSPDALEVGIEHFSYDEAFAEDLVWSGYGDKKHENKLIHKDVKEPLQTLVKAAAKDKVALYPSSIFRSVKAQDTIVKRKIRQKQPAKTIYYTSSPAGYSEHHTGYAVDFAPIEDTFAKTKGYKWLMENAEKYGWQQTFTPEFSAKTGVSEEAWHWRYVGDEHGKTIFTPRTCQPYEPKSKPAEKPKNQTTAKKNTESVSQTNELKQSKSATTKKPEPLSSLKPTQKIKK